jgi:hypothetical protein
MGIAEDVSPISQVREFVMLTLLIVRYLKHTIPFTRVIRGRDVSYTSSPRKRLQDVQRDSFSLK